MSEMLLEIRNASKIYAQRSVGGMKRELVALQDFNLSIPKHPASIVTIAGESGSGKTTLAQGVLGFTRFTSGQIIYDGQDVSTANPEQIKGYPRQVHAGIQDPFRADNPINPLKPVSHPVIQTF